LATGAAGRAWLAELPELVSTLAEQWGLTLGAAFSGGTASYVTAATDSSGRACVLKVAMPQAVDGDDGFARSVRVHRLAGGRGCAELLAQHDGARAMLLERLGPNLDDLAMPLAQLLQTIASTLQTFWRPVDSGVDLPTGAAQAASLADHIESTWAALDEPCPRAVIDRALEYCAERAAALDLSSAVLVHGDAHGWNTLAAGGGTFKFVDPEGLRSERAHDLGVPMREYNEPLLDGDTSRLVRQRAEMLAATCDEDPEAVWQWGFVERVSTGLANVRDFGGRYAAAFLEVAARCV